jgi:hypothetical protein
VGAGQEHESPDPAEGHPNSQVVAVPVSPSSFVSSEAASGASPIHDPTLYDITEGEEWEAADSIWKDERLLPVASPRNASKRSKGTSDSSSYDTDFLCNCTEFKSLQYVA